MLTPETDVKAAQRVDYRTDPSQYKHWKLSFEGPVATLAIDISEDGGIRDGYKLKLNSYDLGVDIELHDALQRIRFEHPEVRTVVVTSLKDRVFCSGANIFMLGLSTHAWKVNFCKFTNETRNGIEDTSRHSGLKFIAAVNGACAGGGYELALACDEILLVDDRSSSVALPEVPLLGVLPGTGGLTRLTDKRKVRHDRADIFCTIVEGIRGERAKQWRLVDDVVKPNQFGQAVQARALELAAQSDRPSGAKGIALARIERSDREDGIDYATVNVSIDRAKRTATFTAKAPSGPQPSTIEAIVEAGGGMVAAAIRARARRRDSFHAHERAGRRHLDLQDVGRGVRRARGRCCVACAPRSLVRARDDRDAAAHARTHRRLLTLAVRADRAGLVFRGHVRGTRVRCGPHLHGGTPGERRRRACDHALGSQFRSLPDGHASVAPCAAVL
jgi:benzoyl-CoA-dihydrodiol lyase